MAVIDDIASRNRPAARWRTRVAPAVAWPMIFAVLLAMPAAVLAEAVGSVVFTKGVVAAERADGARLLAKGDDVLEGDRITTAEASFVVIRFDDDSRMTLRPGSEFVIDSHDSTPGQEVAHYSLLKGGLRALSGLIGRSRPEAVRYQTPLAGIGIRGTDLMLRLCEAEDCAAEDLRFEEYQLVKTACPYQLTGVPPGLYFAVLAGAIYAERDARRVDLDAIAAGYAYEKEFSCISAVPLFLMYDAYLKSIEFDDLGLELYELFGPDAAESDLCLIPSG